MLPWWCTALSAHGAQTLEHTVVACSMSLLALRRANTWGCPKSSQLAGLPLVTSTCDADWPIAAWMVSSLGVAAGLVSGNKPCFSAIWQMPCINRIPMSPASIFGGPGCTSGHAVDGVYCLLKGDSNRRLAIINIMHLLASFQRYSLEI